jgi:hypothetical protein
MAAAAYGDGDIVRSADRIRGQTTQDCPSDICTIQESQARNVCLRRFKPAGNSRKRCAHKNGGRNQTQRADRPTQHHAEQTLRRASHVDVTDEGNTGHHENAEKADSNLEQGVHTQRMASAGDQARQGNTA